MMKQTLLLLLCCLCLWANAQEVSYRPVLIHYNADYKVTKPELGVYKRVAYLPDSIRNVVQPESPRFNGPVRDYYANGVLW
ncbi:MAG: hypothetical protein LPK03_13210, partial [Pontibacter sp.]|nr:hypothetical protein [Pontibacter sp.]